MPDPKIMVERYREAAVAAPDSDHEHYKGLRVHALGGLHAFVAERIRDHLPAGSQILELASGSGAMCRRLLDLGYAVTATDFVEEGFALADSVPFRRIDLNSGFDAQFEQRFDAVVGVEIIEHLENPRAFIRSIRALCRPEGLMVLTTPNTASPLSIAMQIGLGHYQWFDDVAYARHGHITPMNHWLMARIFAENGIGTVWRGSYGDHCRAASGWPRLRLLAKLIERLSSTDKALHGEILVVVGRVTGGAQL